MNNIYDEFHQRSQSSRTFGAVLPGVSPPFSGLPSGGGSEVLRCDVARSRISPVHLLYVVVKLVIQSSLFMPSQSLLSSPISDKAPIIVLVGILYITSSQLSEMVSRSWSTAFYRPSLALRYQGWTPTRSIRALGRKEQRVRPMLESELLYTHSNHWWH